MAFALLLIISNSLLAGCIYFVICRIWRNTGLGTESPSSPPSARRTHGRPSGPATGQTALSLVQRIQNQRPSFPHPSLPAHSRHGTRYCRQNLALTASSARDSR